jgi:dGTPase
MQEHGGFDHNHQSLRIVETLERRYPDFPGLNLSWEVREGILKHETEYDRGMAYSFEPEKRGTLECQIVNAADEIAYSTADLDDGLRSGMITAGQLSQVALWQEIISEQGIDVGDSIAEMHRHWVIRKMVGREVTDLIKATDEVLQSHDVQSADDVRSLGFSAIAHSEAMQEKNRELKDFLYHNLYRHWRVMRMASKADRFLGQLFRLYVAEPLLLPQQVQDRLAVPEAGDNADENESVERVVCDYVAGMTDRYALQEYQKLFDPMERV